MNKDDVIPPSPRVKLKSKSRIRVKATNSSRQKKSGRSIMSLRMKNQLEKNNSNISNDKINSFVQSETNTDKSSDAQECALNIYAGLDDVLAEKKDRAILNDFDILGQPKLIEECNQFDIPEFRHIDASPIVSQTTGLVSVKELLSSQSSDMEPDPVELSQTQSNFRNESEAKEVSFEDIQFSEWPIAKEISIREQLDDTTRRSLNHQYSLNEQSSPLIDKQINAQRSKYTQKTTPSDKNVSCIVHNILNDFDDTSEEEIPQSPPVVLKRRHKRRTYSRTPIGHVKTLIFGDTPLEDDSDIESMQCTQDIDLNSSRRIMENLSQLKTFFTQSQSFQLDFNTDMSQNVTTIDEEFKDFTNDSDDFLGQLDEACLSNQIDETSNVTKVTIETSHLFDDCPVDVSNYSEVKNVTNVNDSPIKTKCTNVNSSSIHLLMDDSDNDDVFVNINTPKVETRQRSVKQNSISTPLSPAKGRLRDKVMHSTPSTSKQAILCEPRIPKRLQFGIEVDQVNANAEPSLISSVKTTAQQMVGFKTAGGSSIQMSAVKMKRTAAIFAGIDEKYKEIDPILEDMPVAKKTKHSNVNECDMDQLDRKSNNVQSKNGAASRSRARSIFGEDFSDLSHNQPTISSFKPLNFADSSNFRGFSTAAGSKIQVSNEKMQRYAQTIKEIDRNLRNEFEISENIALNDNIEVCKTSLNKFKSVTAASVKASTFSSEYGSNHHDSNRKVRFATAGGSSIQISNEKMQRYAQTLKEIDNNLCKEFDSKENDDNAVACKTPLRKIDPRSNAFATSTPNPNSTAGFKNYPPITPINKNGSNYNEDLSNFIDLQDGETLADMFDTSTQHFNLDVANKSNTSMNLNDTNEFQSLNDSIEKSIDVLKIPDEIKRGREKALIAQQAECFKKTHSIHPRVGFLYMQKLLGTMKLHDLDTPRKYQRKELIQLGVLPNVIELNIDNVFHFKFDMWNYYSQKICRTNIDGIDLQDEMRIIMDENSRVGLTELTSAFFSCPSVDHRLVPDHWINNSLKWIILKLASYERSYPHKFAGLSLTPENVLNQLKWRYDREIDKVQRSAIRKITERDDSAAKRMVLFVSRILNNNLVYSLELCDGWYSIRTNALDSVLTHAITSGRIDIGTKLIIQGAELVGIEEGCHPLEMPASAALKISANSTRRARWYTILGFCRESWPFAISLNSVHGNGGVICRMKAYVLRVYPLIYAIKQKTDDGYKTVFRSNKVEQRQNKKDDKKHLDLIEKIYCEASEEIEKEYENNRKKLKKSKQSKKKICDINDGEELWNLMENSNDSFEMDLTVTQIKLFEAYQTKRNDEKQNKISAIVKEKLNSIENSAKTSALQKIRLIDANSPSATKTAILSIWNASESHASLRENTILDLRYVTTNGVRGMDILLTANNFTVIKEIHMTSPLQYHESFKRKLFTLVEVNDQHFQPYFNEFDTFGFVLKIDDVVPNYPFQSVFIVDALMNILCIKFWGTIQQHAYDDIIQVNKFLVISQLEWRPQNRYDRNGMVHAFVTDYTTFSENPKSKERTLSVTNLREKFDEFDLSEFIEMCCEKLGGNANKENSISNNLSKSLDTSANQTIINRPGNIASPVSRNSSTILEKVHRLRNYGTPPAYRSSYLSAKHTPSSLRKPFKTPSRAQQSINYSHQK